MALAGDIGGGLTVTMPSLRDLKNPETRAYVEKYLGFGSESPAEEILKITKLLQNWTAGLHGVGTWHGAKFPLRINMAPKGRLEPPGLPTVPSEKKKMEVA
jgi:4-hydroxybutyryl-CoA dehydratase/vinylacetyl-CoA-Delta-isomerase